MSSRLFQEARERLGLAYAIDAFAESYQDIGLIGVYAGCSAKDAVGLAKVVAAEFRKLADGVGAAELSRAKAQLKAALSWPASRSPPAPNRPPPSCSCSAAC